MMWQWTAYTMWHTCNKHLNDAHSLILFFLSFFFFFFFNFIANLFLSIHQTQSVVVFSLLSSKNLVMTNGKISDGKMLNATKRKDINSKDKNKFFFSTNWPAIYVSRSLGAPPTTHTFHTAAVSNCWQASMLTSSHHRVYGRWLSIKAPLHIGA